MKGISGRRSDGGAVFFLPTFFRTFSPPRAGRGIKKLFFLAALLLAGPVLAGPLHAATVNFNGGSRNELDAAVIVAGSGGTVNFAPGAGALFTNSINDPTIRLIQPNLTLRGGRASGFAGSIAGTAGNILSQADALKSDPSTDMMVMINALASSLAASASATSSGLSFITGNGHRDFFGDEWNDAKWLSVQAIGTSSPSLGNGLNLDNLHFTGVDVHYNTGGEPRRIVNGLIGNANRASQNTYLGNITGNAFTNIGVSVDSNNTLSYLAGGGVVGVRSTGSSASMGTVSGNFFQNVVIATLNSAYLEGGGLIGVDAVSSPSTALGHASLTDLSNNFFTGISVSSAQSGVGAVGILGGGLVSLNNNSQNPNSTVVLNNASGNIFGNGADNNITVTSASNLRGGGVIGLNGLSSAKVDLYTLSDNIFAGIGVRTTGGYIRGGGIVGLQNNDSSMALSGAVGVFLSYADNNLFFNAGVQAGTYLDGGGIIGLRANEGAANLNSLRGNIFKELDITTTSNNTDFSLRGGGVVGVSSATSANLVLAENNYFDAIRVNVGSSNNDDLLGGGVIGIAASETSGLDFLKANTFSNLDVNALGEINGGGIVGGYMDGAGGLIAALSIDGNRFARTNVTFGNNLTGGGVIGLSAVNGAGGDALIASAINNDFRNVAVSSTSASTGNLNGGGVIGVYANGSGGLARIMSLSDNFFQGVRIGEPTAPNIDINGGGIVGARSVRGSGYIDSLSGNSFAYLNTNAASITGGGIVGISSIGDAYIGSIDGSASNSAIFLGNNVYASGEIDGGIIGVTTDNLTPRNVRVGIYSINDTAFWGNTVTSLQNVKGLIYSQGLSGGLTISNSEFMGNSILAANTAYGIVTVDTSKPAYLINGVPDPDHNRLTLRATAGNNTSFVGNTLTDSSGPSSNSLYFGPIASTNSQADASLVIDAQAGGQVYLDDPIIVSQNSGHTFTMTVLGTGGDFTWGGYNLIEMNALNPSNTIDLLPGSRTTLENNTSTPFVLEARSHDFNLNNGAWMHVLGNDMMYLNQANLNGSIRFNLAAATVNNTSSITGVPLTIVITNSANSVDLSGSTVSLDNVPYNEPLLNPGDQFYLLDATWDGTLHNQPVNGHASARYGFTTRYNFIIDKETYHNMAGVQGDDRFLMARLPQSGHIIPAPEAKVLLEGRAASLGFVGMRGSWLADHSYQSADLAFNQNEEGRSWAPFAGIDGAYFRFNTGSDVTLKSTHIMGGVATRDKGPSGSLLAGAFAEAGYANYDTDTRFSDVEDITANGSIRSIGGGLMARGQWANGFRVEGSLRAGRLENEFDSPDLVEGMNGHHASYNLYTPYVAAHAGLAYTIELDEENSFDVIGRYFYTRLSSNDTVLPNGEWVAFEENQSQRLRIGGRITHKEDENISWYVGAAYEHEFDGEVNGHNELGLNFESTSLKGSSGVFDVGVIARSHPDSPWSVEAGLQGYVGEVQGVSGGIRLGYEF